MNRKNVFSYFIWFLYSIVVCVSLLGVTTTVGGQMGQAVGVGVAVGGVWLLLCALLTILLHKLIQRKSSMKQIGRVPMLVLESLVAVILVAVGIILRISGTGNVAEESVYFELTKVAENQAVPVVVHGTVYLYLQLLHLVYMVFGNIFVAGIWLQIVLQLLSGGFFYLAVRKMAGAVSAMVMLGFFMLSPLMIQEALTLSPQMLFLLIFSISLWACAKCICDEDGILSYILAGLLTAVTCYMDILGLVLLGFVIAGVLWRKERTDVSFKKRLLRGLLCICSGIVGFVGVMLVDALVSGKKLLRVMTAWWQVFVSSGIEPSGWMNDKLTSIEGLVLLAVMAFGIFSFWKMRRSERRSIWMIAVIVLLLLQVLGLTTKAVDGMPLLYILATALAGIGMADLFAKETTESADVWADGRLEAQLEAMSQDIEVALVESEEVVVEELTVEVEAEPDVEEQPDIPKIQFIENPLPLPKKHVKKVMDFDLEPKEGMNDFDIDIADDDDFDV